VLLGVSLSAYRTQAKWVCHCLGCSAATFYMADLTDPTKRSTKPQAWDDLV